MKTIQESLRSITETLTRSSSSPFLDAELLIAHALEKDRAYLRAHPEHVLTPAQTSQVLANMRRRSAGEPIAYLLGKKEFWSREFRVNRDVLIPRPETELLIEITLESVGDSNTAGTFLIADLGTGSGAIAITLGCELRHAKVIASDISETALAVAKTNAEIHGCKNISFAQSNWFDNIPGLRFDLIVSNPPYVADHDPHLLQNDVRFEPRMALRGGMQGMDAISAIIGDAIDHLKPGGHLLLEHGFDQPHAVRKLLNAERYSEIQQFKDLQGHSRATLARASDR